MKHSRVVGLAIPITISKAALSEAKPQCSVGDDTAEGDSPPHPLVGLVPVWSDNEAL